MYVRPFYCNKSVRSRSEVIKILFPMNPISNIDSIPMSNIEHRQELPVVASHENQTNSCLGLPPPAPFLRKTRSSQKLSSLPNQAHNCNNEVAENSGNNRNFEDPYDGLLEALMNISCNETTVDNGVIGEDLSSENNSTNLNK